jgi:hypothetical protein
MALSPSSMFRNACVQMLSARSASETAPEALVSATPSSTARGARAGSTGVSACNSSHRDATRPGHYAHVPSSSLLPSLGDGGLFGVTSEVTLLPIRQSSPS